VEGLLVLLNGLGDVRFDLARVLVVWENDGATRGRLAHLLCTQLFVCVAGAIEIVCDDGREKAKFALDTPRRALLLPPTIWAEQTYRGAHSVLLVLCDRPYESHDYVRDYARFRELRGVRSSNTDRSIGS
jgi:hypothetical protein